MTDPQDRLISRHDPAISLALLTRLPVRVNIDLSSRRGPRAAWAYPLVGALLGACIGLLLVVLQGVGLPPPVAAALGLATLIVATGALHEDGLADTVDGFWGGWTLDRRLMIMKDSQIGTYGALALLLSVLVRWTALTALVANGVPIVGLVSGLALSRAGMVALWSSTRPARADGLAKTVGQPTYSTALLSGAVALAITFMVLGPLAAAACGLATFVAVIVCRATAIRKIGGHTGDVLGATEQICQCVILVVLTAFIQQT